VKLFEECSRRELKARALIHHDSGQRKFTMFTMNGPKYSKDQNVPQRIGISVAQLHVDLEG